MVTRNCNNCQEQYEAEPRYLNRGQGLFCSRACSAAYHAEAKRVKHEPNTQCSWCGIDFYRQESHKNAKSGRYYCSVEHQSLGAAAKLHSVGPEASTERRLCPKCNSRTYGARDVCGNCYTPHLTELWLNGDNAVTLNRSRTTGLPTDTKGFVKQHLLDTRGDACEECGFNTHGPFGSIIQMDHINGNCFDNRIENLKLLCPNCHAMTETYGSRNKGSGRAHRRK